MPFYFNIHLRDLLHVITKILQFGSEFTTLVRRMALKFCSSCKFSGNKLTILVSRETVSWPSKTIVIIIILASQFSKILNFLFLQFKIIPMITQVGWLRGGAIREQIFFLIRYTFGVGMYDIQLSSILWTCN